jgi:hypothetical protein
LTTISLSSSDDLYKQYQLKKKMSYNISLMVLKEVPVSERLNILKGNDGTNCSFFVHVKYQHLHWTFEGSDLSALNIDRLQISLLYSIRECKEQEKRKG